MSTTHSAPNHAAIANRPNQLQVLLVLASNTFRQTVRQRLFFNVGVFGLLLMSLGVVVGNITFGSTQRVTRSIGLTGVSLALDLMALLVGCSLIYDEIDRKTLFVVLARPVRRWQYVVGRYLGLLAALAVALCGFVVVLSLALLISNGQIQRNDLLAIGGSAIEAAILGAVGIFFSSITTPLMGAGMGLGFWIAAASTDDLVRLTLQADPLTKGLAAGVAYVLPSLARLNFREAAVYGDAIDLGAYFGALGYGCIFAAFWLLAACISLNRREML